MQRFFRQHPTQSEDLFGSFGTINHFRQEKRQANLEAWLGQTGPRTELASALRVVFQDVPNVDVEDWINDLPALLTEAVSTADGEAELLEVLIKRGLLPRYAFPVDVVALWTERPDKYSLGQEVARGLGIALSEFAPSAEVIIDKKKYLSEALYDPFEEQPNYRTEGWYFECDNCQTVHFDPTSGDATLVHCPECLVPLDLRNHQNRAIRPSGFATDWTKNATPYRGGGRERAGFATKARLSPGEYANGGDGVLTLDGRLWTRQRTGDLYITNKGSGPQPGFLICQQCGRFLRSYKQHTRPTDSRGQKAGTACSGQASHSERLVLVHSFRSDVAVLGPNIPDAWDVDYRSIAGRAVWRSVAASIQAAAAVHLQIDPEELAAGDRPWRRDQRMLADIYLYDTVPNGAGYARDAAANIEGILRQALKLTADCKNGGSTACYQCLLDYGNQFDHALLNRNIASDFLEYLLEGWTPQLSQERTSVALHGLMRMAPASAETEEIDADEIVDDATRVTINGRSVIVFPVHTFSSQASSIRDELEIQLGLPAEPLSEFDLLHRPLGVWQRIQSRLGT